MIYYLFRILRFIGTLSKITVVLFILYGMYKYVGIISTLNLVAVCIILVRQQLLYSSTNKNLQIVATGVKSEFDKQDKKIRQLSEDIKNVKR